ncbi:MAG: eCIS core domain-containing protein [Methylobacter sp.]
MAERVYQQREKTSTGMEGNQRHSGVSRRIENNWPASKPMPAQRLDNTPLQRKSDTEQQDQEKEPLQKNFEPMAQAIRPSQDQPIAQLKAMLANSPRIAEQRKMADLINNSQQQLATQKFADSINNSPALAAQRKKSESLFGAAQPMQDEAPLQRVTTAKVPAQREAQTTAKPNNTGLPDNLKSSIESLSGMSMDHVKVNYNSSQPAQLNALAYAQGSDIHIAPGQEQHLPHEAWHVVQQAQGRVKPTMQMKDGLDINDDKSLEHEADVMGMKAVSAGVGAIQEQNAMKVTREIHAVRQRQPVQGERAILDAENIGEFLSALRSRVEAEANIILAQINQTTAHCPYILKWFQYYGTKDAAHIMSAIERFAPQSQNALTMSDYIEFIIDRMKQALTEHVNTGSTKDIPSEILDQHHEPEDFLHIAKKNESPIQRACLTDCFKSKSYNKLPAPDNDLEMNLPPKKQVKTHGIDQGNGVIAMPGDNVINISTTTCGLVVAYSDNGIACYHWPFIQNRAEYFSDMEHYVKQIGEVTNIDVFSNRQPLEDCRDTLEGIKGRFGVSVKFHKPEGNPDRDPFVTLGANSSTSMYGTLTTTNV